MRQKIAAGNWKMHTSLEEALRLTSEIVNMAGDEVGNDVNIILNPPFPYLSEVKRLLSGNQGISLGAQNCHQEASGAYTGEVSAAMLASMDVEYVILGHSERREYFAEGHDLLATKTEIALSNGLKPIFCCGEKLEVREQEGHFDLVQQQVEESLFGFSSEDLQKIVIAYEPVWAIGTGVTASSDQAQEMHAFIRQVLEGKYGKAVSDTVPILYGGSVKPGNAQELFACPDVDGGLVGGASLKSRDFIDIAKSF